MVPPGTAPRLAEVVPSASWGEAVAVEQEVAKSRVPGGEPFRSELRERLSRQRAVRKVMQPPVGQAIEQLLKDTTRGEWEFSPARPTAPDRKIRSLGANPWGVEKAKEQCEDDKFAKSAVESVRSRLAWWRKRGKEHKVSPYPITVEHLQLLGSLYKRARHRSAGHIERGEERAHSVGARLIECFGFGAS